jgi:phospho-N-acetylmuramoyl-pentapeptide-transferase
VLSFLIVLALGPRVIRLLVRMKLGDSPEFDHADLNELTRHKSTTPTMGGILIVPAIFFSVVVFADVGNFYVGMGLLALVWLGCLGAADDWIKLKYSAGKGSRDGLKSWEKILFQIALAVLLSIFMYRYGAESAIGGVNPAHRFFFPGMAAGIALSHLAYSSITVLTMVGASNAVNLTDGMDGLAAGVALTVSVCLLVFSWISGVMEWSQLFHTPLVAGSAEMTVFCAAIAGSCVGFLWYNAPPAQVFMGDTGSLPLGGLLGYIAVISRQEIMLLIAGGVFVLEAGSVMLQVGYFKWTKRGGKMQGRRIFRCAPLHHHFHLGGWAETKVVIRFWLLSLLFAALALATLKIR